MRPSSTDLLRGGALVLLVFAAFLPALGAGFIWDDDGYVTQNPLVHADDGLRRIWLTTDAKDYYPLTYTSFWIQWRLWGDNPAPYHAVNLIQHALAVLLLWRTLVAARVPGSWLSVVLFAVHPLNVESVAWIAQQKNTLALLLFAGSAWALTRHVRTGSRGPYILSFGLFTLSLLAKPLAAFWPLVLPLYMVWLGRRPLRRNAAASLPFLIAAMVTGGLTLYFQHVHSLAGQQVTADGPLERVAHVVGASFFYLKKTLLPIDLCAIYPPSSIALGQPVFGLLAVIVGWVVYRRISAGEGRTAGLIAAYYVAMLLPVSGLFAVGFMFYAPVADHWAYAALIAVIVSIVAPATVAWSGSGVGRRGRIAGVTIAFLLTLVLALSSHERSKVYRNQATLFQDTLARNAESWASHTVLGTIAFHRNELPQAERHFESALALKPGYWEALNGLGAVYALRGEPERAIPFFEEVLRQRPDHAYATANLERARREVASGR